MVEPPGGQHAAHAPSQDDGWFRAAFDEAAVGMAVVGLDGRFLRVNDALCAMVGRSARELLDGDGVVAVGHPDERAIRRRDFRMLLEGGPSIRRDRRYVLADGSVRWGHLTLSLVRGADGRPQYCLGQLSDITARKLAEDRAERRAAQQAAVARLSQLALTEPELPAVAVEAVRTACAALQVDSAALGALRPHGAQLLELAARDLDPAELPAPAPATAGAPQALDPDDQDFVQAVVNVLRGAQQRVEVEADLRHQSLHDPLTALPNRVLLLDRLRQALARSRRDGRWVALMVVDLDDFKHVNESLGHDGGDELLRETARRLDGVLRPSDTLARCSGDEFAIVCDGLADTAEAMVIAERVLAAVGRPLTLGDVDLRPSATIGIALAAGGAATAEHLVRDADTAMTRAKSVCRGGYELFDDAMRAETLERMELTQELRRAIERSELEVVYQPVVSLAARRVVGFEALARWTHPERGEISPGRFIPLAEERGLIGPLGSWVLAEALRQVRAWRDAGQAIGDLTMSVNVSRVQLGSPDLADEVAAALATNDLAPDRLIVEVTESAVMEDETAAHTVLGALNAQGVGIALDDFGVGQSSLACLRDLPLDSLKLDRGFITSLASSPDAAAIVRAVTDMAHTLEFRVVAEGIELEEQAAVVAALGCDLGQGFLFSRPLTPEQAPAAIERLDAELGGGAARR